MTAKQIDKKFRQLKKVLEKMGSVLIAFSGGADSTFLLRVATEVLGKHVLAVTAVSEIQPAHESKDAQQFAEELGVNHVIVRTNEMKEEDFISNPTDRCYHCKKMIFSELKHIAIQKGIPYVIDGSNADDMTDYRPGLRALRELNIRSPLRELNFTKAEIRALSKTLGLPTWNRPALACLASRIPYGTRITPQILRRIDAAESFLRAEGFEQVRVRDHGNIARIEVSESNIQRLVEKTFKERLIRKLRDLGYLYITVDLEGYRSGSLNQLVASDG